MNKLMPNNKTYDAVISNTAMAHGADSAPAVSRTHRKADARMAR